MKLYNDISVSKIIGLLSERYCPPGWIFIDQLRGGTGFSMARTIDAYAIYKWHKPGEGYSMAEVKTEYKNNEIIIIEGKERREEII